MIRVRFSIVSLVCVLALAILLIVPLRTTLLRLAIISLAIGLWFSLLCLIWKRPPFRNTRELQRYEGVSLVSYVYGGENSRGVDCSGLVRAAMVRSLTENGIASLNPSLLRSAFSLWRHDSNAIQLGKCADGFTSPVGSGSPTALRAAQDLRPGDLAVPTSGSHVLAYLEQERWIEADPDASRVHIVSSSSSPIAGQEVSIVRWRWLQSRASMPDQTNEAREKHGAASVLSRHLFALLTRCPRGSPRSGNGR